MKYEDILAWWKKEKKDTKEDIYTLLDNFKILFAYHSGKISSGPAGQSIVAGNRGKPHCGDDQTNSSAFSFQCAEHDSSSLPDAARGGLGGTG